MNEPSNIETARFPRDLETVRTLFREYAAGLGFDLRFQGFEDELATWPCVAPSRWVVLHSGR